MCEQGYEVRSETAIYGADLTAFNTEMNGVLPSESCCMLNISHWNRWRMFPGQPFGIRCTVSRQSRCYGSDLL
jgi:hypothetical protein